MLAAAVGLALALSAPQALGAHVSCGDVITADTRLDSDLLNCPSDGVVIGAANVTLDLNGHIVDGDTLRHHGIVNSAGHDGVAVKGPGTVRDFGTGITLINASDNVVRGLEASANGFGIRLDGHTATNNLITRNVVSGNVVTGIYVQDEYGGNVEAGDNRVQRNKIFGNGDGIVLGGTGNGNRLERNILWSNGIGIFLSDSFGDTLISKNAVSMNCVGISLLDAQNAHIERNTLRSSTGECLLAGAGDGIHVSEDPGPNLVSRNVAERNSDDGIDVGHPSNTVRRNTANMNGDLGIEAVFEEGLEAIPGLTDGGGNRASANGNPAQCVGVECK